MTLWTAARQAPLSIEFSRQEYWSGLPCPSPYIVLGITYVFKDFIMDYHIQIKGFPGSSAGKESTYNAGGPSSILGLGRCPGERVGYPLGYSWVCLVAQMVKNPLVMQETWVWSFGWKDPLEEGMETDSSIFAREKSHGWRNLGANSPWGGKRVGHDRATKHKHSD